MGKSAKHKKENIHHFISFSERISNVNVDVIHLLRHVHEDGDKEATNFGEALLKWTDLDLTEHFTNFRREISGQVQTFEQLVHHKDAIIAALKTHLAVKGSLALNALLDLLVQLARDLQQDFAPHFKDFFHLLTNILSTRHNDVEALEHTFQALAFLYRILWRFLIKDFEEVFGYFSYLLKSQKDYMRVFAAESCAYLLRKVKKRNELLNFLFKSLKKTPELTDGVGLLLFEMIKGVKNHFHTVSEEIFPMILLKLDNFDSESKKIKLPLTQVEEAVRVLMQRCAEHTTREHSQGLWTMLLNTITTVHTSCKANVKEDSEAKPKEGESRSEPAPAKVPSSVYHLARLCRLTSVWLDHEAGGILDKPDAVAKVLLSILKSSPHPDILGADVLSCFSSLLASCETRLAPDITVRLTSAVFAQAFNFSDLKSFVRATISMPVFEKDILPGFMNRIHYELPMRSSEQKDEVVAFLTEILLDKCGAPVTGDNLDLLKRYPLDLIMSAKFSKEHAFCLHINSSLTSFVKDNQFPTDLDFSQVWGAVVCAPHLSIANITEKLSGVWARFISAIKKCEEPQVVEKLAVTGNQILKSIIVSTDDADESFPIPYEDILEILNIHPGNRSLLQTADFYFSHSLNKNHLTQDILRKIYTPLEANLVSPSHTVRLLTCHLLSLFPVELKNYDDEITREDIFTTLLAAEKLLPTVNSYRDKLIYLRRLEYDVALKCLPEDFAAKAPLLFLLGNQHWNFKLLWEPLADIIASHAHGMEQGAFWEVMHEQLQLAATGAEQELIVKDEDASSSKNSHFKPLSRVFSKFCSETLKDGRRTEYTNFRVQLWRGMRRFSDLCGMKCDDLCTLYLNFLKNEYHCADVDSQYYQNIVSNEPAKETDVNMNATVEEIPNDEILEQLEEDEEDIELEMDTVVDPVSKSTVRRRRPNVLSLLVHLDLFALFKKQKFMFKKPEVQETFHQLLKDRNNTVQKAAFEVVITYKSPHLVPYRENFNRLLDDKTFKSEIVLFRVDEENSEVKVSDREGFLPVLMKILYGKMYGKAGKGTAGTSMSQVRKSIVFGFLTGCKTEELKYFLELLFEPCMHFVSDDPLSMVKQTVENINLEKMIPLKRIKGVLSTVHTILLKVGHGMAGFTRPLMHVLLGLASLLTAVLDRRDHVIKGAINLVKTLRAAVLIRVTEFLEYFEDMDFTTLELDALFQAVVWPTAEKLVLEGVHHPTPLLKLFTFWSTSTRLMPLLGHHKDSSFGLVEFSQTGPTPLSCMFLLLNAPTVSGPVAFAILEIVYALLVRDEEEEEDTEKTKILAGSIRTKEESKGLGETLISPHVPELLTYLRKALSRLVNGTAHKKQSFILELKILALVSKFVTSAKESHALCDLLIPYLARKSNLPEDVEENTLASITNLMAHVTSANIFYRQVAQLFFSVERRASRALLCQLFKVINKEDEEKSQLALTIEKMNAWDKRKAEEPDFLLRLDAFQKVNASVSSSSEPDINLMLVVVYNCCHFIHFVDDLSIRDNATNCLTNIVTRLAGAESNKAFNVVVEHCLAGQVKNGLNHQLETVRHEFLAVLQSLVMKFPNHQLFAGLSQLCDADPEADFFENIRHIQIHKRSRALRRLYRHLKDHTFTPDLHITYFLPLIYAFITDSSYAKHASVQDAAVDLLGAVCKQLPWQHYQRLLQFYLKLLPKKPETQRQIVRIIVSLMDGFHFDLSNSTFSVHISNKVKPGFNDEKVLDNKAKSVEKTQVPEGDKPKEEDDDDEPMDMQINLSQEETEETILTDPRKMTETPEGKLKCSPAAATRIHKTIVVTLLPALHRVITQRAAGEAMHKLAGVRYPEDDEILRVPIALAMIKLLQMLPRGTLENRLPGILLKICYFLKSRSRDIRSSARETMQKAALSLGARFFPFILKELQASLTRGYQLHVLGFTAHFLLHGVQPSLKPGDLDPAISMIQAIYHGELFGQVAEEKEVAAIREKYFEAKLVKAYDAYEILARFVSPDSLAKLIKPVREILEGTGSQRVANKSENLLRKIGNGLMANPSIPIENMMVFVHGLTTKLMDTLAKPKDDLKSKPKAGENGRMPQSCLILQAKVTRGGMKPAASKKTNAHLLVEFGLHILDACLKQSVLSPAKVPHLQMLDPFVVTLRSCLSTGNVKTTAGALRCLTWVFKFPLPALKEHIVKITEGLFLVLQTHVGSAMAKGGNQELMSVCFRAMTVLVREVTFHQISRDQLQVLLTYCEEDLYSHARQSTAFSLVRAILYRKLDVPQLHQVMDKLFATSVVSPISQLRMQSRQVLLHYLMNYPLGKQLRKHLFFYIDHLQFEQDEGRESAAEMITSMVHNFPQKILNNHCSKFFSSLAMAAYNDNSIKCRRLISASLKSLIGKLEQKTRKVLFQDVFKWMKSEDIRVRTMGCQTCGLFVEVEGVKFENHLESVLPLVVQQADPSRFSQDSENQDCDNEEDDVLTEQKDINLLGLLSLLTKLTRELNLPHSSHHVDLVDTLWEYTLSHQLYPHSQVRLAACQLAGMFFSAWEPSDVARLHAGGNASPLEDSYLMKNCPSVIRTFGKAFCEQLRGPVPDESLATQAIKNLVYLGRLAEAVGAEAELVWLAKRLMREANHEVIYNVKVSFKRGYVFKWAAALGVTLSKESVSNVLPIVLPALQREAADEGVGDDGELKTLVQEVMELLKKQVGVESFTAAFAKSHQIHADKKDERKRNAAAIAVTDPDIAARKKIRKHQKEKEAKKRRREDNKKPDKKRIKKSKLSILNVKVDED